MRLTDGRAIDFTPKMTRNTLGGGANIDDDHILTTSTWSSHKINSELSNKADKTDTVLDTTLSRGRKAESTVGTGSLAFGNQNTASEDYSVAFGQQTIANGKDSLAEGDRTTAKGDHSHAEGSATHAGGTASHTEGNKTIAEGTYSSAQGTVTYAKGSASHAEGYGEYVQIKLTSLDEANHAYTYTPTDVLIENGDAILYNNEVINVSQVFNIDHIIECNYSFSVSMSNTTCMLYKSGAYGGASHVEGHATIANGRYVHAQGAYNEPDTVYPLWVTNNQYNIGDRVSRSNNGYECITPNSDSSFISSKWKKLPSDGNKAFMIGNGTNRTYRSNAFEVDWDGNGTFSGKVTLGENPTGDMDAATKAMVDGKAEKADTVLDTTLSRGRKANTTVGNGSFAFGNDVESTSFYSFATGNGTKATESAAHAEGTMATASGNSSHAEGSFSTASGMSSHAEGTSTKATGSQSHAEGENVTASGSSSHAEGSYTTASGYGAHAEGISTTSSGRGSHVEGTYTIANSKSQHVFGEYNISDSNQSPNAKGTYIEIVGNGTPATRSNARTLDWSGNEWIAGNMTVAGGSLKVGNTTVTEAQLQALLALLS